MTKEYLGVNAVNDLFDIIDENYVSKEDFENKEKLIASAVYVGTALIAKCLLNLTEAVMAEKGAEGGEMINDTLVATASEVGEALSPYFNKESSAPVVQNDNPADDVVDENDVATKEDTNAVIGNYFN